MTPDERTLLQRFLQDLVQSRPQGKDAEADGMIADALRASPDAGYVLVQHAIMSDQALHAAQDQIADLQAQLRNAAPAPAPPASFLPQQGPWSQPGAVAAPPVQSGAFFGPGPFSGGGGLGSFLRSAGTMAAGVAGGELLFDGLSGLFGGHRGFGGGFGGFGGGFGGSAPVENVTNNYYDDNAGGADFSGGGGDFGGGDAWNDNS